MPASSDPGTRAFSQTKIHFAGR